MRYTLQYGVVVSKPSAASWAQAALDARWTPLIQAALAWSTDYVPDLSETLRFIDDTRQASAGGPRHVDRCPAGDCS
jgi:aminoglycoside adenylyltransferase-like protein